MVIYNGFIKIMAHYAYLDKDNIVISVITGKDEDDIVTLPKDFTSWDEFYLSLHKTAKKCLRTSYNTFENSHAEDGTAFRGNFAGVGMIYDTDEDVFYLPKPFESWTLDKSKWNWQPPVAIPNDAVDSDGNVVKNYGWNEDKEEWEEVSE